MDIVKYNVNGDEMKIVCGMQLLPPPGYSAINLCGVIFTRKSKKEVEKLLETERGKIWINHEHIHTLQKKATCNSWICFYAVYLYYFFKMWPFYTTNWSIAYRTIPYEYEAYTKQSNYTITKSYWKYCIYCNKKRLNAYWRTK